MRLICWALSEILPTSNPSPNVLKEMSPYTIREYWRRVKCWRIYLQMFLWTFNPIFWASLTIKDKIKQHTQENTKEISIKDIWETIHPTTFKRTSWTGILHTITSQHNRENSNNTLFEKSSWNNKAFIRQALLLWRQWCEAWSQLQQWSRYQYKTSIHKKRRYDRKHFLQYVSLIWSLVLI